MIEAIFLARDAGTGPTCPFVDTNPNLRSPIAVHHQSTRFLQGNDRIERSSPHHANG